MSDVQIVGLCLVRNEERFLDRVLANAAALCDRIIIADHRSADRTPAIARRWAERDPRFTYRAIRTPPESQDLIQPFVNTPTWIFGVDGDEIYDPRGLAALRLDLLSGRYASAPRLYGNVLHCVALDEARAQATGYLAPPSRSMTKLYNFELIQEWRGPCTERLHGGSMVLKPGFDESMNVELHQQLDWDRSPFRCLHVVFLRRSALQKGDAPRPNIAEKDDYRPAQRLRYQFLRLLGREPQSGYKFEKYQRGERVTVDARPFFPDAPSSPER